MTHRILTLPVQKQVTSELHEEIQLMMLDNAFFKKDNFRIVRAESKYKKIPSTNRATIATKYTLGAMISALKGDFVEMSDRFLIAENNSPDIIDRLNKVVALQYCGFISESIELIKDIKESNEFIVELAYLSTRAFDINLAFTLFENAKKMRVEITGEKEDTYHYVLSAERYFSSLGIDNSIVNNVFELVGAVARNHRKVIKRRCDDFIYSEKKNEMSVSTIFVDATYDEASQMTHELIEAYLQKGLDNSMPFMASFQGNSL